jgi:hypothetical protein
MRLREKDKVRKEEASAANLMVYSCVLTRGRQNVLNKYDHHSSINPLPYL